MPSTDLIFRFLGIDAGAGREFDRMAGKVDTAGVKWKDWALGAGVAIATVAAGAIHLADEWEQAHTRLEGAITNVGGNFDSLSGQVSGLDSHMAKFGFTATDVESSLAPLVTATKNPTQAMHLMGLAADVARGRNIALKDATNLLVKVETGHVSLLGRYGIATKTASGSTITMTQAIQRLTTLYGGDAQRFAGTFTGKLAALRAEATNLGIKIGSALIPVVTDLLTAFEKTIGVVGDVIGWFKKHQIVAGALAGILAGMLAPAVVDLALAFGGKLNQAIGAALASMVEFVTGTGEARTAVLGFEGSLGPIAAVLAVVGAVAGATWAKSRQQTEQAKQAVDDFVSSLHIDTNSVSSITGGIDQIKTRYQTLIGLHRQFESSGNGLAAGLIGKAGFNEAQSQLQALSAQMRNTRTNTTAMARTFNMSRAQVKALATANGIDLSGSLQTVSQQFAQVAGQAKKTHQPVSEAAAAFRDLGNKANTVTQDVTDLDTAWASLIGNFVGMKQADLDAKNALVAFDQALKKSHDSLSLNTKAGRDARGALFSYVGTIKQSIDATYSQTGSYAKAATAAHQWLQGIKASGAAGPIVRKLTSQIQTYLSNLAKQSPGAGQGVGKGFGQGIVAGLRAEIGAVHSAASDLGGIMLQGTQSRIRSHSPSLEAMKIGQNFDHGIVIGIKNGVKTVRESAHYVGKMLLEGLTGGWTGVASKIKSSLSTPIQNELSHLTTVLGRELTKQQAQLTKAESAYKSLRQARTQAIKSLQDTVTGSADISNVLGLTDVNGNTYTGNVRSMLGSQLSVIRDEASKIGRLRKMGLSEALLRQISAAAPADAVTLANQILSGQDGSIASLNRQESLIQRYAKQTATTVVESPGERHQLEQAKAQVRLQREQVKEQRKTNHHLERIAARDIAHGVSITLSGHTFNPSKPHDLRKLVAELKKLGHNVSVG